jgi:AcrR family transcriptional regulator
MGRRKLITDKKLLEVARNVFLQKGATASTKDIAARAGISEAAIYQRYPTKAGLFLAAMMPPIADVDAIIAAAADKDTPQRGLSAIGHRMLDYFRRLIPVALQLLTHPEIGVEDFLPHYKAAPPQALIDGVTKYLSQLEARGEIRKGDHRATAALLVSAIHSLPLFELLKMHGSSDLGHAVDFFVQSLWLGLQPVKERKIITRRKRWKYA